MPSIGNEFGSDKVDGLVVELRANTQGFAQDTSKVFEAVEKDMIDGFERAGNVLERGLLGAIRKGSLGFDDLKRIALAALGEIAEQAIGSIFHQGGDKSGGIGLLNLGGLVGSILGLPGRATGGTVSPGRGYLVGERGPELFVPTSAGRVESNAAARGGAREVRVSINVVTPQGSSAPQALQRSTRQVASAVRRALTSS
jgi:hypothetical protein